MKIPRKKIERLLKSNLLTFKEAQIIRLKNGIGGPSYNTKQISRILRCTPFRVTHLEAKGLRKLKKLGTSK